MLTASPRSPASRRTVGSRRAGRQPDRACTSRATWARTCSYGGTGERGSYPITRRTAGLAPAPDAAGTASAAARSTSCTDADDDQQRPARRPAASRRPGAARRPRPARSRRSAERATGARRPTTAADRCSASRTACARSASSVASSAGEPASRPWTGGPRRAGPATARPASASSASRHQEQARSSAGKLVAHPRLRSVRGATSREHRQHGHRARPPAATATSSQRGHVVGHADAGRMGHPGAPGAGAGLGEPVRDRSDRQPEVAGGEPQVGQPGRRDEAGRDPAHDEALPPHHPADQGRRPSRPAARTAGRTAPPPRRRCRPPSAPEPPPGQQEHAAQDGQRHQSVLGVRQLASSAFVALSVAT